MIWAILAEKNEDKVDVNQDESLTDLQTLIKYSFLLNFLHESLMNLITPNENLQKKIIFTVLLSIISMCYYTLSLKMDVFFFSVSIKLFEPIKDLIFSFTSLHGT